MTHALLIKKSKEKSRVMVEEVVGSIVHRLLNTIL